MGEPITMHKPGKGNETITVYGRAVAAALMAAEGWSLTAPDGGAGVVEPDVVVAAPQPEPAAEETIAPKGKGKARK